MGNAVGWFEIFVDDMARAKAFYEAMLGIELSVIEGMDDMLAFPMHEDQYGAPGALVKSSDHPAGGSGVMVYFSCEDCAVEAERAAQAGGTLVQEKTSIGEYGAYALVEDTEGNRVGLHSLQ